MTRFDPDPQSLRTLQDMVVVLTGGSTGIGAATVTLFHSLGARVVFGDVNSSAAETVLSALPPASSTPVPIFVPCDVTTYSDNVRLFKTALSAYGRVDHAVANAGLVERPGWFDAGSMSLDDVDAEPDTAVLDVNLKAVLYFARVACAYLAYGRGEHTDRSLTLLSSVAGLKESPGLFVYQASKHGVMGLMRSLRLIAPHRFGVRTNCVCPWLTLTKMAPDAIRRGFEEAGLPSNEPGDVARIVVGLAAAGPGLGAQMLRKEPEEGQSGRGIEGTYNAAAYPWGEREETGGVNGRAIYVEGGRGWDIEEGLAYTQPYWMGKSPCERLVQGQRVLGQGNDWTK